MSDLRKLRHLMQALRAPAGGCPWDKAQSFASIVSHTLEEAYEVADVIESGRLDDLPSELGDLLFQVIFYCQLGEEVGRFTLDDVVLALEDKLTRRHPHVFGNARAEDAEAASEHWETLKAGERRAHRGAQVLGELDDVPVGLPALSRAQKLQKRAARVGFDCPMQQVLGVNSVKRSRNYRTRPRGPTALGSMKNWATCCSPPSTSRAI